METRMVKIGCTVPNGIMIRLSKPGVDDGTGDGVKMTAHDGPGKRLNGPSSLHTGAGVTQRPDMEPGYTEVDAEWWGKWFEQNKEHNILLADRHIFLVEEDEQADPTQRPSPAPSPKAES